jgi:hypothetical protein
MKRFARLLLTLCIVVSLLMCMASAGLWTWGSFEASWLKVRHASNATDQHAYWVDLEVWNFGGTLHKRLGRDDITPAYFPGNEPRFAAVFRDSYKPGWKWDQRRGRKLDHWSFPPEGFRAARFDWTTHAGMRERAWVLGTALWLPTLAFAVLPWIALVRYIRRRRAKALGLCPACGYDLRATPSRCPECGLESH